MAGFTHQCGETYSELANISFEGLFSRSFQFPGIDDQQFGEDGWSTEGELRGIASTCLMKLMHGAPNLRMRMSQLRFHFVTSWAMTGGSIDRKSVVE